MNFKSIFTKVFTPKTLKNLLLVGGTVAGVVYVVKNPDLGNEILSSIINPPKETQSHKNFMRESPSIKNYIPESPTINNIESNLSDTFLDITDKLPRNSPILHTVSGYTKKNGTHVESYPRGKTD